MKIKVHTIYPHDRFQASGLQVLLVIYRVWEDSTTLGEKHAGNLHRKIQETQKSHKKQPQPRRPISIKSFEGNTQSGTRKPAYPHLPWPKLTRQMLKHALAARFLEVEVVLYCGEADMRKLLLKRLALSSLEIQ